MLTLQYVPYREIQELSSVGKIRKLLNMVSKENKIVLLEGRLKKEEEAELIKATMEEINHSFKGIELAVINPSAQGNIIRSNLFNFLLGDRQGFTIIGPASIVKNIKKDPDKLQLFLSESKRKRKR